MTPTPVRPDPLKVDDEGYYVGEIPWWWVALFIVGVIVVPFLVVLVSMP